MWRWCAAMQFANATNSMMSHWACMTSPFVLVYAIRIQKHFGWLLASYTTFGATRCKGAWDPRAITALEIHKILDLRSAEVNDEGPDKRRPCVRTAVVAIATYISALRGSFHLVFREIYVAILITQPVANKEFTQLISRYLLLRAGENTCPDRLSLQNCKDGQDCLGINHE